MKISIVTVTLNNKAGLLRAIESVRSQTYKNVEHIIVDGGSTDGTVEAIKNYQLTINNEQFTINNLQFLSEADDGIYDAINKGIKMATGDVIGLLHSDDFYKDEFVLEKYAEAFEQDAKSKTHSEYCNSQPARHHQLSTINYPPPIIQAIYSDLVYVKNKTKVDTIPSTLYPIPYSTIRYWKTHKSSFISQKKLHKALLNGWMPPHPTLFLRKEVFEKYGLYKTDMKIAADYEMVLRLFYKYKITTHYLPFTTYCMTIGGASNKSLKNILIKSSEDYKAMKLHKIPYPFKTLLLKNIKKLPQFFLK